MARPEAVLLEVLLRRPEPRFGLAVGLGVAVVLHLLAIPGTALMPKVSAVRRGADDIGLAGARGDQSHHQRVELTLQPPRPPAPKPDDVDKDEDPSGQVITLPALKEEKPDAADYLAEQSQRTDRETRARVTGQTQTPTRTPTMDVVRSTSSQAPGGERAMVGTASAAGGPSGDGNSTSGDAVVSETQDSGGGAQKLALDMPRVDGRQGLVDTGSGSLRARTQTEARDGNSDAFRIAMGRLSNDDVAGEGAGRGGVGRKGGAGTDGMPGQPNLVPGLQDVARLAGLPRADHLLAEEDDATSVNAFAFKYATYFNRMTDAVRVFWSAEGLRRVDPKGNIYGIEDRTTILSITIDRDGHVVDIAVQDSSGVDAVDDDALMAVKKSEPYPHPPKGLFRGEATTTFTFRFTIENGRRNAFWRGPPPPT